MGRFYWAILLGLLTSCDPVRVRRVLILESGEKAMFALEFTILVAVGMPAAITSPAFATTGTEMPTGACAVAIAAGRA